MDMNEKEIKAQMRQLKKLKLALPGGNPERVKLHRQIKDLQAKLSCLRPEEGKDAKKDELVKEILRLDVTIGKIGMNLYIYSNDQLAKHLEIIKRKVPATQKDEPAKEE